MKVFREFRGLWTSNEVRACTFRQFVTPMIIAYLVGLSVGLVLAWRP